MNLAILNKLYEIADKVFDEGVNVKEGNYTASDLAKMKDSAFKDGYLKTETKSYKNEYYNKQVEKDLFIAPMASVNVLSFVCSFCVVQIFALVAKFEKLASIGSKKRMFIKQKDNNEVLCTVKVLINKYYSKLSLHCANDDLRPSMKNVCLDIRNGRAAASDGHTMMIKGLDVEMVGFVGNEPVLVRQETYNKLLVRFLGGVWCPKVVENWVRTVERNKNKDIENVNDSYMFGVIENDRKHKSSDFHVSFYYRG